jgi:hypothetical protein
MRGPDGGSVHDPGAILPGPMWDRTLSATARPCAACRAAGRKLTYKWSVQVADGPRPGSYLICRFCDWTRI